MTTYRLAPIDPKHLSWRLSDEKGCVWAGAATPKEARDLVAGKTKPDTQGTADSAHMPKSPWQNEAVTSCVWEPSMAHIRAGTIVRTDGSAVGD